MCAAIKGAVYRPISINSIDSTLALAPQCHWAFVHLQCIPSQHHGKHTTRPCLLAQRTHQFTVPSLPSLVPLFSSLVWKRLWDDIYVRLAQDPHYDRHSWNSNPWPSDHWIDTVSNSATCTVAHNVTQAGWNYINSACVQCNPKGTMSSWGRIVFLRGYIGCVAHHTG